MKKKVINVLLLLFLIFSFSVSSGNKVYATETATQSQLGENNQDSLLELIFQQVERPVESVRHCRLLCIDYSCIMSVHSDYADFIYTDSDCHAFYESSTEYTVGTAQSDSDWHFHISDHIHYVSGF